MSSRENADDRHETDDHTENTISGRHDDSDTSLSEDTHGYKFVISNNTVTSISEVKNGYSQQKNMEYGETWRVSGNQVIKTETEHSFTQTSIYEDANGDGVFTKVAQTYTPLSTTNSTGLETSSISGGNDTDDQWSGTSGSEHYYGSSGNDTLHGDSGNDDLYGGNDNDDLYGDEGDDHLFGSNGNDHIYGGTGTDHATCEGKLGEYGLVHTTTGIQLTDSDASRDGTDTLESVERIHFSDTSLALDTDGIAGQAYRLYRAAFDRESDDEGLGYWMATMENGETLDDVANAFISSQEFQSLYGENCTDEEFVSLLYNNVLNRDADTGGYEYWLNQLDTNLSRTDLLVNFSESGENQSNVAELIGNGIHYKEWPM